MEYLKDFSDFYQVYPMLAHIFTLKQRSVLRDNGCFTQVWHTRTSPKQHQNTT